MLIISKTNFIWPFQRWVQSKHKSWEFNFILLLLFFKSCSHVWFCHPMDCSMPSFPVLHHLPEFAQTPLSRWCYPNISSSVVSFSSCLQSFSASGSFPMSQLFAFGGQSTVASASALVLPMNIQDWLALGLTGLISLLFKGFSTVFSTFTVGRH